MPLWSENRHRQSSSRSNDSLRFRHRPYAFDTSSVVPLQSSSCQSPDLVLSRPFPSALTTMAFAHSRQRWFGTCSCKPVTRGLPSSIQQLHTLGPPRPFALVAHDRRRSACIGRRPTAPVRLIGNLRDRRKHWPARATWERLAAGAGACKGCWHTAIAHDRSPPLLRYGGPCD